MENYEKKKKKKKDHNQLCRGGWGSRTRTFLNSSPFQYLCNGLEQTVLDVQREFGGKVADEVTELCEVLLTGQALGLKLQSPIMYSNEK